MGRINLPEPSKNELDGMSKYGISIELPSITGHCFRLGYFHAKQHHDDTKQQLIDAQKEIAILKDSFNNLINDVITIVESAKEETYYNAGMGGFEGYETKHPANVKANIVEQVKKLLK